VLSNGGDEIWHDTTEPREQLIEGHGRLHEIGRLLAQHLDEAFGVGVEEVAEEFVRRLSFEALR
jgi:hypothetical protein